MIPRELYRTTAEDDDEETNKKYFKVMSFIFKFSFKKILKINFYIQHRKMPLAPQERKKNSKDKRANKFDPNGIKEFVAEDMDPETDCADDVEAFNSDSVTSIGTMYYYENV